MPSLREAATQALEVLIRASSYYDTYAEIAALEAALAQEQAESTGKESLTVPPEIAATMTAADIAWLETRRMTKLWREFGQMRWAGADEGWDRAIDAVRGRLNDECQAVLDWKVKMEQAHKIGGDK